MHCRNELEDDSPDCMYNCISSKCYRSVFKRIIDKDTGRVSINRSPLKYNDYQILIFFFF